MSKLTITRGPIRSAMKVVIYGPEGIGKTTLASRFPNPLFIDTEGSTKFLDVARTPPPKSWAQLLDQVSSVWEDPSVCGTLVLDTADWAEQLCTAAFCASKKISGIEELGYGKGYVYLAEDFARLLNTLGEIADKGVHVVLTAHAKMRKFEQPDELGAYDRWELKLQKSVAPLVKEWSDLLLFANYKTFAVAVDKEGRRHKAQGGKRVIYTSHHPCWDAKNRLGLPEELPMEYGPLAPYFGGNATPPPASAQVAGDGSPRGATPTDSPAGVPPVGAGALARPSPATLALAGNGSPWAATPTVPAPVNAQVQGGRKVVVPFDFSALLTIPCSVELDVGASSYWSEIASMQTLDNLLMQKLIPTVEYLKRLPAGQITDREALIAVLERQEAAQMQAAGVMRDPASTAGPGMTAEAPAPENSAAGYGALQRKINETGEIPRER